MGPHDFGGLEVHDFGGLKVRATFGEVRNFRGARFAQLLYGSTTFGEVHNSCVGPHNFREVRTTVVDSAPTP